VPVAISTLFQPSPLFLQSIIETNLQHSQFCPEGFTTDPDYNNKACIVLFTKYKYLHIGFHQISWFIPFYYGTGIKKIGKSINRFYSLQTNPWLCQDTIWCIIIIISNIIAAEKHRRLDIGQCCLIGHYCLIGQCRLRNN
jgi:hypothetical protein